MTKLEFEELQRKFSTNGMTLKSFLKASGVAYSTFNYWSRKIKAESAPLPIAPITLHHGQGTSAKIPTLENVGVPGVVKEKMGSVTRPAEVILWSGEIL